MCPRAKVTIDSLLEVVYEKSIGTKMNDLHLCLEVVQGHVNHCGVNISKTARARDFKFGTQLCMGNADWCTNNFPSKWAWPRSCDPYNLSVMLNEDKYLMPRPKQGQMVETEVEADDKPLRPRLRTNLRGRDLGQFPESI